MIQSSNSGSRHIIPRWSDIRVANILRETTSLQKNDELMADIAASDLNYYESLLAEWRDNKSLPLAIEILTCSNLIECETDVSDVRAYAVRQLSTMDAVPELLRDIVHDSDDSQIVIADSLTTTTEKQIAKMKQSLIAEPRNTLKWCELARNYLILGQNEKSKKALGVALQLSPNHRTVLRAAAAFYAHTGDYDIGLAILRKSPIVRYDPWVLSSEIALANECGHSSKFVKAGIQMLDNTNINPAALSELASELSTMDFQYGDNRRGRKKLQVAKAVPHENAVAQMTWIDQNICKIGEIIADIREPVYNYEAEAKRYIAENDWNNAIRIIRCWQDYQPFSKSPAMDGSYIAADFLNNQKRAMHILEIGLRSNPEDLGLLNNYAYSKVMDGQLDDAGKLFLRILSIPDAKENICILATFGLYHFRCGEDMTGRALYQKAIDSAKKQGENELALRATIYLAREEKRLGHDISSLLDRINKEKTQSYFQNEALLIEQFDLMENKL